MGPRNAIRELSFNAASDDDKVQWVQKARLASILGSVSRSLNSTASGVRCWMHFASQILKLKGRELPPSVDGLLAFSCLFRNAETYGNYLAHIRLACELLQVSTHALDDRSIKRAKKAIRSRAHFTRRAPMFIYELTLCVRFCAMPIAFPIGSLMLSCISLPMHFYCAFHLKHYQ